MKKIRTENLLKLLLAVAFAVTLIAGIFAIGGTAAHAEAESPALPETHAHTAACPADGNLTDGSYYLAADMTGNITVTAK